MQKADWGAERGDSEHFLDKFGEKRRNWIGQRKEKNWAEKERDDGGRGGPSNPTAPGLPLLGIFSK